MKRYFGSCLFVFILLPGTGAFCETTALAQFNVENTSTTLSEIQVLSGADGLSEQMKRGGRDCIACKQGEQPSSVYLYFAVPKTILSGEGKPVYAEVSYYDNKPGTPLTLEYDSSRGDQITDKYCPAEEHWGGARTGSEKWKRVVFLLQQPRFAARQNLGASFRLGVGDLYVESVTLSTQPPEDAEKLKEPPPARLKSKTRIGADRNFIIGGFDIENADSLQSRIQSLQNALPALRAMGLTSHEAYVRWNLCEPEPGRYDWSFYDAYVDVYRHAGVKWVPFLIIGPAYSLPDWYYKQPGSQGYVCLEHNEESDVQSLWNPVLRGHVAQFIQAFCEHYRDEDIIESILLGITGNYGEAIYVASGNDWTANIHGEYHTHGGLWAGDPYAREDFRKFLADKYGEVAAINAAWNTAFDNFDGIEPFLRDAAPNNRAWLDFAAWYIGSMNDYTRFWVKTVRDHFPGRIEICTGGHAPVEHGADFGEQCKIAADYGAGVRITNEGSDYRANFSLTRWVASAGQQYGTYYSFEPAGVVNEVGVVARIYNVTASAARGLHYYYPNLFETEKACDNFVRYAHQYRKRNPIVEVAAYYPETHIVLNGNDFLKHVQPLRDHFDFGYCSDNQIADGGLENYKALLLLWGNTAEKETWERILAWVQRGGLLITAETIGVLQTVEGDTAINDALLGENAALGCGRVLCFSGQYDSPAYRRFLTDSLAEAPELRKATRNMMRMDGREDNVFVTVTAPQQLLWLNMNDTFKEGANRMLPPYSIVQQKVLTGTRK